MTMNAFSRAAPFEGFCCLTSYMYYDTIHYVFRLTSLSYAERTGVWFGPLVRTENMPNLQFRLLGGSGLAGSGHSLDEAEARVLDGLEGGLLVVLELLVSLLELLDRFGEVGLGVSRLLVAVGDGSGDLIVSHSLDLFDLSLLLIVAEVDVGGRAARLEAGGVGLERLEVAAALVVLEVGGISGLDGGETLDTVGVAERLALGGAVNVSNEDSGMAVELFHEFVPIRLHLLAVPSPWRLKLDEGRFAGGGRVPIGGSELGGGGKADHGEEKGSDLHVDSQ